MRRDLFAMPPGIYLDGNILGLMPHAAREAVLRRLVEWQRDAVGGWDTWFGLAESMSPQIARLVGTHPHEVIATGSITANLHSLLATLASFAVGLLGWRAYGALVPRTGAVVAALRAAGRGAVPTRRRTAPR